MAKRDKPRHEVKKPKKIKAKKGAQSAVTTPPLGGIPHS